MSFFQKIRNGLLEPQAKNIDVNSDEFLAAHRKILMSKPIMRTVFTEFYDICVKLNQRYFAKNGSEVEIGAGVSFFKTIYPHIISTDIKNAANLDMVLDAQQMNLPDNSVRAIYGINCFHHFPQPDLFFKELDRVLVNGGGCVLIEPYYGWLASKFYKKIFETECFIKTQKEWSNPEQGVMYGANQALSYIVFKRDRATFEKLYPQLEIVHTTTLKNYPRYFLSGGLNFKQLIPNFLAPVVKLFEFVFSPLASIFALHHIVVLRKK